MSIPIDSIWLWYFWGYSCIWQVAVVSELKEALESPWSILEEQRRWLSRWCFSHERRGWRGNRAAVGLRSRGVAEISVAHMAFWAIAWLHPEVTTVMFSVLIINLVVFGFSKKWGCSCRWSGSQRRCTRLTLGYNAWRSAGSSIRTPQLPYPQLQLCRCRIESKHTAVTISFRYWVIWIRKCSWLFVQPHRWLGPSSSCPTWRLRWSSLWEAGSSYYSWTGLFFTAKL